MKDKIDVRSEGWRKNRSRIEMKCNAVLKLWQR